MPENRLALIDREVATIGDIAPGGYLLALRIGGTSPLQAYHTYPQAWIDEYTQNGYMLRDPLMTWALTIGGTVRWSSALLLDPFRIFRKAAKHGLHFGASVAHGPISSLTICSMARADREFSDEEIAAAQAIVVSVHDAAEPPQSLTEDEKRILDAMAAGLDNTAVAKSAGVSVAQIDALYARLFARTQQEVLRHAKRFKLI